tara:strand:+ start:818 stop:1747 length:930 start_codon:yes stop_codon:yes gene_type:complete
MKIGYGVEPEGIRHVVLSMISAIETASNPGEVSFLVTFDPRKGHDIDACKKFVYDHVDSNKVEFLDSHPYFFNTPEGDPKITTETRAGIIHGLNLDQLISESDDEDLLMCDADTCFLMPGWDDYLVSLYSRDNCPIVGSSMPDGHQQNWEKFPYIDFCLVHTPTLKNLRIKMCKKFFSGERDSLAEIGIDIPYEGDKWHNVTKEDSSLWGKAPGKRVFTETGWKMCYIAKTQGINFQVLPCTSRDHLGPRSYWYKDTNNTKYVVSHMGNSRKRPFGSPYHLAWINDIGKYWEEESFDFSEFKRKISKII